jgi:MFS family permease
MSAAPEDAKPGDAASAPDEPPTVTHAQFLKLFSAVGLPMFMAVADQTLLATAIPVIAGDFGQLHDTSWIATAYLLTSAVMIPVYGRLGDRYGRRELLFAAMAVFMLGHIICALSPSMGVLILGRAIEGLGGGGLMTLSQAMIGELVAPRQRIRFLGYFGIMFMSANVLGPIIGGFAVAHIGWRWLFGAHVPLCLFAAWRLSLLPRGKAHPGAAGVSDVQGLLLFVFGTAMLLFALSSAGHRFAWLSLWSFVLFGGGLALWVWLLRHERRLAAPFFPMELLRNHTISLVAVNMLCQSACYLAVIFYLPVYLRFGLQMPLEKAGLMLVPVSIGIVAGAQTSIRIAARIGRLNTMPTIGMGITAVALFILALSPPEQTLIAVLGFFIGVGLGPSGPGSQMMVQTAAGPKHLGAASSVVMLSRTAGSALGAAVAGAFIYGLLPDLDAGALMQGGTLESGHEVVQAFHITFFVMALVATFGTWNASRIPRVPI